MTESDVKKRLDAGEDPLDLAIEKWMDIREGRGEDRGSDNCALCIAYECCSSCPVYRVIGDTGCDGTPYNKWYDHRNAVHKNTSGACECPKCEKIADKEIAFLKSLKK